MTKEELERLNEGQDLLCGIEEAESDIVDIGEFIERVNDICHADICIHYKRGDIYHIHIDLEYMLQVLNMIKECKQRRIKELQKQFDEL